MIRHFGSNFVIAACLSELGLKIENAQAKLKKSLVVLRLVLLFPTLPLLAKFKLI
jgi:hypothetical protein